MSKLVNHTKEIAKIKIPNFKDIPNENLVTDLLLLSCAEFIEEYNCGFLPLKSNINGLQNFITMCINLLDEDINLLRDLSFMLKYKNKENRFSFYYEELEEELEDNDISLHLLLTKTFIKVKLYNDILKENKK